MARPKRTAGEGRREQGRNRTEDEAMAHRADIAVAHMLRGESLRHIGARLGIHPSTVQDDVNWLRTEWLKEVQVMVADIKAEQWQRIKVVEAEAFKAWQRSQEPEVVSVEGSSSEDEPIILRGRKLGKTAPEDFSSEEAAADELARGLIKVHKSNSKTTTRNKVGDPRYLDIVLKCIDLRLRMFGVYDEVKNSTLMGSMGMAASADASSGEGSLNTPLPGFKSLAARLGAGLSKMAPAQRTEVINRFYGLMRELDRLNQEAFGLPSSLPTDDGTTLSIEQIEPKQRTLVPANIIVVDGEARYVDEEGNEVGPEPMPDEPLEGE